MKTRSTIIFGIMFLIVFSLGCIEGGEPAVETKLEENQGLGIVGSLKIDELNPGLTGYISLTVRNNVGGEDASDIYVSIDNVKPFKIVECGNNQVPNDYRLEHNCRGQYELDSELPFRIHGVSKMFPGEEIEFFWNIRAPSADEISDIALKHPIYYDLEYTYKTSLTQNLIFMSQQEVVRRRQSGEEYQVSGEARNSAGELKITGYTQQPIIYFFSGTKQESAFDFALQYNVENIGKGIPRSDVVILFEVPETKDGINISSKTDESGKYLYQTYGWKLWSSSTDSCYTGMIGKDNSGKTSEIEERCTEWVKEIYGTQDFSNRFDKAIKENRLFIKVIKRTDFVKMFNLYVPLELTSEQMQKLKNDNIPIQISTFKVHAMYRYFTEGKDYITVYPIRI